MAMLRINVKRFNTGHQGAPVSAHAQYLLRQMPLTEHITYALRERASEHQRDDLVASGSAHLPGWAQGDVLTYWTAAQTYSRKGGVVAKEIEVALPRELTRRQNTDLIQAWLAKLPAYPTCWAFHEPRTRNGKDPQPHVHILISPRPDDGRHPDPVTYFKQPNHGGVTAQQLWTQKAEIRQLWKDWEQLLRSTLRAHGLEQTLDRDHKVPEIALSWREMRNLRQHIQRACPDEWGHEHLVPRATIETWTQHGLITVRQATWLVQRGQRQADWKLTQEQQQLWEHTETLGKLKPWQVLAKRHLHTDRERSEATIQTLQAQRRQLAEVYTTTLQPALKREQARYRETHSRVLTRGRSQAHERSGDTRPMDLPVLDAALRAHERQREQERAR